MYIHLYNVLCYAYPITDPVMEQLCLNLGDVPFRHNGRGVRPIPPVVEDLFDVDDSVSSGLVWKNATPNGKRAAGEMAGSALKGTNNKFLVSVRGYGNFYTHRIVYYLKHKENPGSMVVRHLSNGNLALGWQSDNGRDDRGKSKPRNANNCKNNKTVYLYKGRKYNLGSLCSVLGLSYATVYQKLHRTKATVEEVFGSYGVTDVEQVLSSSKQ